jgi:hypothetical protein
MDTNVKTLTTQGQPLKTDFKNLLDKVDEVYNKAKQAVEAKEKAARDSAAAAAAAVAASGSGPSSTVPPTSPVVHPLLPHPLVPPPLPLPLIPGPPPPPPPPPHPLVPAPVVRPAAPPRAYGKRVYPIHNGVLTYYVLRINHPMPAVVSRATLRRLVTSFDLPPETRNVKIELKETRLARYQIAPITLDAEVTFTLWETSNTSYDVFYCGMYEPGPIAKASGLIEELKSPPELS